MNLVSNAIFDSSLGLIVLYALVHKLGFVDGIMMAACFGALACMLTVACEVFFESISDKSIREVFADESC